MEVRAEKYARDAIYDPRSSEISRGTTYCEVPGVSPDNTFLRNGTAILIEGEPTEDTLDLSGCRFEGNGTDIDNRSGQPLDISQAVFQ